MVYKTIKEYISGEADIVILSPHIYCRLCGCSEYINDSKPKYLNYPIEKDRDLIKNVQIVRCSRCGFYQCNPMPIFEPEDYAELYNPKYYASPSEKWEKIRINNIPKTILKNLQRYLPSKDIKMLDVGAGEGLLCDTAKQIGWHVEAIESNENMKYILEKKGIKTFVGNINDMDKNKKYDVITMCEVIEHIYEYDKYLTNIYEMLKSGGILFVALPNEDSLYNNYLKLVAKLKQESWQRMTVFNAPYHLVGFNKHNLEYLLKKHGFIKISINVHAGPEKMMKTINDSSYLRNKIMTFVHYIILSIGQYMGKGVHMEGIFTK